MGTHRLGKILPIAGTIITQLPPKVLNIRKLLDLHNTVMT